MVSYNNNIFHASVLHLTLVNKSEVQTNGIVKMLSYSFGNRKSSIDKVTATMTTNYFEILKANFSVMFYKKRKEGNKLLFWC